MAKRIDQTEFHESLPVFEVELFTIQEPEGSYDMFAVRCPRTGCRTRFWVALKWRVLRANPYGDDQIAYPYGRPCPHCSKASAIPEQWRVIDRPADEAEPVVKPKPRIVKRRRSRS